MRSCSLAAFSFGMVALVLPSLSVATEVWTKDEPLESSGWVYNEKLADDVIKQCQVQAEVQAQNGTTAILTILVMSKGSWAILIDDEEWTKRIKMDWGWNEGERFDNVSVFSDDAKVQAQAQTLSNLEFLVVLKEKKIPRLRPLITSSGLSVNVGGLTMKTWLLQDVTTAFNKLSKCKLVEN